MWVDCAMEAAVPFHNDRAAGLDAANDPAISGMEIGVGVGHQLDHAPDPHPGCNPGREQASSNSVHALRIVTHRSVGFPRAGDIGLALWGGA
jgi:hypothetical protein